MPSLLVLVRCLIEFFIFNLSKTIPTRQHLLRSLFVGSILLLGGCSLLSLKQPVVDFVSFRLGEPTSDSVQLIVRINITNTSVFPILLEKIDYRLSLNNHQIFDGKTKNIGVLKPNRTTSVDMPVYLVGPAFDFFVDSLLQKKQINYTLQGVVNGISIRLSFDHKGTVYVPEIQSDNLDTGEVSLKKISASLALTITNNNNFPLPLKGLMYAVHSRDKLLLSKLVEHNGLAKNTILNLSIPLEINTGDLVTSSLQLLQNPVFNLHIDATADFGFLGLTLRHSQPIRLR